MKKKIIVFIMLLPLLAGLFSFAACSEETITVTFRGNKPLTALPNSEPQNIPAQISNIREGSKIAEPTKPTLTEHIFLGWFREAAGTNEWIFDTDVVTESIALFAKWERIQRYTVTWQSSTQGVQQPLPPGVFVMNMPSTLTNIDRDSKINSPASTPTLAGYTFGGWYKENTLQTLWDFSEDTVTENIILYAKWTENAAARFTVSFNENKPDGAIAEVANMPDNITDLRLGDIFAQPDKIPTLDGYTFGGWYRTEDAHDGEEWDFIEGEVFGDMTLYAKWTEIILYSVTYSANEPLDENDPTEPVGEATNMPADIADFAGGLLTKPADPELIGYVFGGWYADADWEAGVLWDFDTALVDADLILYARWVDVADTFSVTFIANEPAGTATDMPADIPHFIGGRLSEPTAPELDGYVFDGWYTDADWEAGEEWDFNVDEVDANVTLYAKWILED
ncbi:MAG: InlB B-repeat-containing protein [Firmicutes bacterium]|nr:InlB B-repeat-containing protein [Bacillota bacterium]